MAPEAPQQSDERGAVALAVRRPVGVLVGALLVMLFGLLSVRGLPIQLTPDIAIPTLTVTTAWPGAAPAEVEREILEEQEAVLKGLPGLDRMVGQAEDQRGTVTLEFEVGTAIEEALVRVTNRLSQVPDLPESARPPILNTSDSAGPPLAVVLVQAADGGEVAGYGRWVEDEIVSQLERIPGVAGIRLFGGRSQEVEIRFDPAALAARGVTVADLSAAVRGQLRDLSAGDVDLGKRRYVVRTGVAPEALEDLERSVLKVGPDGAAVRLGDVAEVRLGLRKADAVVTGSGVPSLAMLFSRESGSNVLEVTEAIKAGVAELQESRLAPQGLTIRIVSDQTGYINGALDLVRINLLLGGALAVGVLLLFLRSLAASAVVATAIPICVAGTALGMSLLGRTVNVVSRAGMAFAVGMVVDNAIVVLENIDTWRRRGAGPARASIEGAREVWGALVASTLTTAAVFLPVIQWQDEVGELLRDVAVAISVAVSLSLVVSVLVIPSLAARLKNWGQPGGAAEGGSATATGASLWDRAAALREAVAGQVQRLAASRAASAGVVVGSLAAAALVIGLLLPPMEYLPTGKRNFFFGVLVPPPGYSVAEVSKAGAFIEGSLHAPDRPADKPALGRSFFVARPAQAFMGGEAADPERLGEVVDWVKSLQRQLPGFFGVANPASLFGRSIGASRAVDVELTGPDLEALIAVGGPMLGKLKEVVPDAQIRPIPSLDLGAPELRVVPRREEAAALGLSAAGLGEVVDALVDGRIVGELSAGGASKLDVVLRPVGGGAKTPGELESAPVATPSGQVVPLAAVARLEEVVGPSVIQRVERRRAITLQVSPPDDLALEEAMERIRAEVIAPMQDSGAIPEDIRVDLAGTADKLSEAKARFGDVLALAVLICFLLLAALFEDFLAPLVILVTLPLAGAGGVLGLRAVDALLGPQAFDMMTALGFVILVGVVVNNAILVVDGALARLREGVGLEEAVASAVRGRVRPIFMSALTSIAGLTPLVLFPGSGSELYRGVGAIVLGGLALSTVLTLYVVPALFALVWRLRKVAVAE